MIDRSTGRAQQPAASRRRETIRLASTFGGGPRGQGVLLSHSSEMSEIAAAPRAQASDAELRFFYDAAPVLMGAVELLDDGDLLHRHDNPASNRFFGLPAGSTQGRSARSLGVPEDTISLWRGHYAESARSGAPVTFDYAHPGANGVTWLSVTVAPLHGPGEAPGALFGYVARDVTARRLAETALGESEERFRATFELAAVGIAHVGLDGRWIRVNRRLCEILGYSAQELAGLTFQSITHPDDLQSDLDQLGRLLAGEIDTYAMEKRYYRKDGAPFWAELTVSLVRDARGQPAHLISVVQDISQRHAAETALRAAEERLSLAAKASALGVWEWDLAAGHIYHSVRAKEICGFGPEEEITYEKLTAQVHPDDLGHVQEATRRAFDPASRQTSAFEYRIVRPDGALRWLRSLGDTVFEARPQGAVATRYVGTLEDITERKQSEQRLDLLAREVDHRANNLLAVIQGVVSLSTGDRDPELRHILLGRIAALGHAHKLLAEGRWTGADLLRLLQEELRPFGLDQPGRVVLEGPRCSLSPPQAQAMGMALHELATNAAKYGSLSSASGSVLVRWTCDGRELDLQWAERGGPKVAPPRRQGLGSRILERAFEPPIGGEVTRQWPPEGHRCRIRMPLDQGAPAGPAQS